MKRFLTFLAIIAFGALSCNYAVAAPAEQPVKVIVMPDHADWNYKCGEQPVFKVLVLKNHVPMQNIEVNYQISEDNMPAHVDKTMALKKGEGEIKMYFDGEENPTICGTGAEDYVGCAWGLTECTTPYQGCTVCDSENKMYSFYRWHVPDPVCFNESIKVTIMQMGFGDRAEAEAALGENFVAYPAAGADEEFCYYDRSDDYCSTAFWYQTLPTKPFPLFPTKEERMADLVEENKVAERNDL